jgi:hypothetical protein
LFTNAQRLNDLAGFSVCVSVSAGAGPSGGGQFCAGLTDDGKRSGVYSFFAFVGASLQPGASVQVTYNRSGTIKLLNTPELIRKAYDVISPDLGPQYAPGPFGSVPPTGPIY